MKRWTAALGFVSLLATISPAAFAAEPEPNGDRASAPSITGGLPLADFAASGVVVQDGTLEDPDVDYFAFGVRAGEPVSLALFEPDGGALVDPLLVVFDGAGAVLAQSDDDGPGFLARLALVPAADDTWVVAITRAATLVGATITPGFGAPFAYELVVAANGSAAALDADVAPGPQGANDSAATAQPLAAGESVVNGELAPDDADWYAIAAQPGDVVTVSIFEAGGGAFADPVVQLLRGGAEIAADDDGGTGFLSAFRHEVAPGGGGTLLLALRHFDRLTPVRAAERFDYELVVAVSAAETTARRCDANGDGAVDHVDVDAIFAARNTPATGPDDVRDADGDGRITLLDGRQCTLACDRANCAAAPPPGACGLGGLEAMLVVVAARRLLRSRR